MMHKTYHGFADDWWDPVFDSMENEYSFLSGGMNTVGPPMNEALVNPRPIGFNSDPFYIPIYWSDGK